MFVFFQSNINLLLANLIVDAPKVEGLVALHLTFHDVIKHLFLLFRLIGSSVIMRFLHGNLVAVHTRSDAILNGQCLTSWQNTAQEPKKKEIYFKTVCVMKYYYLNIS